VRVTDFRSDENNNGLTLHDLPHNAVFEFLDKSKNYCKNTYVKAWVAPAYHNNQGMTHHCWVFDLQAGKLCRLSHSMRVRLLEAELSITGVLNG